MRACPNVGTDPGVCHGRIQAHANGRLSDANFWKASAIDGVTSVGSIYAGGRVGGFVAGRVGGGYLGAAITGASVGGTIDLVLQGGQNAAYLATNGQTGRFGFSAEEFGTATIFGGALGVGGRYLAEYGHYNVQLRSFERATLYSNPLPFELVAPEVASARFGNATSASYKATFFEAYPELQGKVVVHHAVEQQVLKKFPGVVSAAEMHSLENLRGIPKSINGELHLSKIRVEWNRFYKPFIQSGTSPTQAQLLQKATELDSRLGHRFTPPVGGKE